MQGVAHVKQNKKWVACLWFCMFWWIDHVYTYMIVQEEVFKGLLHPKTTILS